MPIETAFGRWEHFGNVSTWLSSTTWRPLPRREFSVRKDYDVLVGTNRHTITLLVATAAVGRAAVGRGPQALGHPCRHHSSAPATQTTEPTVVETKARRFQLRVAVSPATARSIGK